ncbi:MBL fold metallo-hydrolase [Erysipelothrix anatis]|uniref:MBL fold metallo-hydrolase n=1 Tax=Erysipelothrix anatis TaxID=2683713 RepID=UPI00140AE02C|nr:MBL fold metallo-hydrolase [Erysipelothrix anatis]
MKITKQVMGYVETNTYYLEIDNKVVVIDPCMDPKNNAQRLLKPLEGKEVIAIYLTHGHFDHISGVDAITEIYKCPVFVFHEEAHYLTNPNVNLSNQMPESVVLTSDFETFFEEPQTVGPFSFDVIKTPGHTSGSVSFIFEEDAIVGDFIFKGTIGRTDLPTGSMATMNNSLKMFIEMFEDEQLNLYPGHGDITDLDTEKLTNPFIQKLK